MSLQIRKWKSVSLSFNKASGVVQMAGAWRLLVNRFLNNVEKKVSDYVIVIQIYILLYLYVGTK